MDQNIIQFACRAISDYLQEHPRSADTLEGVHQWWIKWPDTPELPVVTELALRQLEQAGQVQCLRIGNREIWRLRTAESIPASAPGA